MYRESRIGGPPELNKIVEIDECLFIHDNNTPIWVIGGIETDSRKMRFDVINRRISENIKTFLLNHVEVGTKIISDGWQGYAFLDGEESVWGMKPIPMELEILGMGYVILRIWSIHVSI